MHCTRLRLILAIVLTCVTAAFVAGCSKSSGPEDTSGDAPVRRLAMIPKGTTHVFWKTVEAGAVKAAEEFGVHLNWVGPEKEDDRAQQIQVLETQALNRMDGILLAPLDAEALVRPVKEAIAKGIPVVIFDSGLNDSEGFITSYVATDNQEGGRIGGRELAKLLGGVGRVVLLRYQEGSDSTAKREAGFLEALGAFHEIEIISDEQYAGATKAQAQEVSENLLLRFKEGDGVAIDGIFCPNESSTYGMMQALRRNNLAGKVTFVGFDASAPLIEGMRNGEIHGLVVQNPHRMGYLAVKTMVEHLDGKPVESRIDTGVSFITRDQLEDPEVLELIDPKF